MNIKESISEFIKYQANSLVEISNLIDESYVLAIESILMSKKIVITGVGKSGLIAKKISATFTSVGLQSVFLDPSNALHGDLGIVSDGDIIILISKSGSTEELIRILPYLKNRGKTISICSNKASFIAKNCDINLNAKIEKEGCPIDLAPMASTTSALVIGDALAATLMKINNFRPKDFAKNHPMGQLGKNLTIRVDDIMHKEKDLPLINTGSSFKEAIIEMTKKNLGCVLVIENDILLGLITDGDIRRKLTKIDDIKGIKVKDIMTETPITIKKDIYLGEALSIMENRKSQISLLPVVDDNNYCIGLIRVHDIVKSGI